MPQPKEIFVDTEKCTGCKTCEIACAVEHSQSKVLYEAISETPKPKSRIYVEWVAPETKVPIVCRQCEDAPCMHACISGAITRNDENIVLTSTDKCIGCWTCVMVCPFGVIGRHLDLHKAYRCDRCPDHDTPVCVSSCPTQALVFNTVASFSQNIRKDVAGELIAGEGG